MIANILSTKKVNPLVIEFIIGGRKLNNYLVLINLTLNIILVLLYQTILE